MLAGKVVKENDIVTADDDVVVFYKDTMLQAGRALYDTNRSTLELFDRVIVMKNSDYALLSDYLFLDLKKEKDLFSDYFLTAHESQMWARGKEARRDKEKLTLQKAFLSSCDVSCPDWHIEFTSAEYNTTTQWLDIWNPRFYLRETPIFYLPYIGTSLVTRRKSGLLRPRFGISDRDGFIYEQPLYLAVDPQWDFELTPQWRSSRGNGLYGTFRFVDTPHSHGYVRGGYFGTRSDYIERYDLKNRSHYGIEWHYENGALFFPTSGRYDDGLYMDIVYLNDPDYINLQAVSSAELAGSSQVQSRINYFVNTPDNYLGFYGKYFIDTSLNTSERRNTFQNIPTLQLHHYQTSLLGINFLQYSADYRYNHFFTESGRHIQFQEINFPLALYWSTLDDYLKFSVSENLYYSYSSFDNMDAVLAEQSVQNSYYSLFRNYHTFDLYTDLARSYGKRFHTMQMRLTYNKPSFSKEEGDTLDYIQVLRSPRENLQLSTINYLYDEKGREVLYYRIAQPVLYEPIEEVEEAFNRYGDLEQEIRYTFLGRYEFYTDLFWSYYLHQVSGATSHFKIHDPRFDIMVNHFFKQRLDLESTSPTYGRIVRTSDFFTLNGKWYSEGGNDYYGTLSYDNLNNKINRWSVGMHLFKKCWNLDFGVRDEILPILTSAEEPDNIHNITFYFTINLVPFGTYTQTIQQGM